MTLTSKHCSTNTVSKETVQKQQSWLQIVPLTLKRDMGHTCHITHPHPSPHTRRSIQSFQPPVTPDKATGKKEKFVDEKDLAAAPLQRPHVWYGNLPMWLCWLRLGSNALSHDSSPYPDPIWVLSLEARSKFPAIGRLILFSLIFPILIAFKTRWFPYL